MKDSTAKALVKHMFRELGGKLISELYEPHLDAIVFVGCRRKHGLPGLLDERRTEAFDVAVTGRDLRQYTDRRKFKPILRRMVREGFYAQYP